MKGPIHQEEISTLNIYAPNTGHPSTLKKILEDLNTPQSPIDRSSRQKIKKKL
jgi:hypothetical protein